MVHDSRVVTIKHQSKVTIVLSKIVLEKTVGDNTMTLFQATFLMDFKTVITSERSPAQHSQ
jgi:hypothetical protein